MKNVKVEQQVILAVPTAGQLTGEQLLGHFKTLPIDKDSAIMNVAIGLAIKELVDRSKEYLTERCTKVGIYTHSSGLTIRLDDKNRKTVTNPKIEKLRAQIKEEEKKILDGKVEGEVHTTPYESWSLVKATATVKKK
jgi:triphosphoribosyl-dephospho-CoA synthetase